MRRTTSLSIALFMLTSAVAQAAPAVRVETLVPSRSGQYPEVRYISVRGTNTDIGRELATLGKNWLSVQLLKYPDPLTAQAHRQYLDRNDAILRDRMAGVAKAYGIAPGSDEIISSSLVYDRAAPASSFPTMTTSVEPRTSRSRAQTV